MNDARTSETNLETYTDSHGWQYRKHPEEGKDCRCLVTLDDHQGMTWIGLRAYHHAEKRWYNGNEPERATVRAWMPLPPIANRSWAHGKLLLEPARSRLNV